MSWPPLVRINGVQFVAVWSQMPIEIEIKIQSLKAPISSHHRACPCFPVLWLWTSLSAWTVCAFCRVSPWPRVFSNHRRWCLLFLPVSEGSCFSPSCLPEPAPALQPGWWLSHKCWHKQQQIFFSEKQHLQTGMNSLMVTCWIWGLQVRMAH